MSQTIDRGVDNPVNPDFDPLDPDCLAKPYPYFRSQRELWAEWTFGKTAPASQ